MNKKPAAFFDRDGVICEYVPELCHFEQFEFRKGIAEAMAICKENGYHVFVATNQPNIAKAKMSLEELERIHDYMVDEIKNQGGLIDKVYYCPHRVGGKVEEYAFECDCRKPNTGMLKQASEEYEIDLSKSFMVGDTWRDSQCAKNFNIDFYALSGGGGFPYKDGEVGSEYPVKNIYDGPLSAVTAAIKNLT